MFQPSPTEIKEYARLAIEIGVNVQVGQPLEIRATIDAVDVVRECVKLAYEKGASYVDVQYMDDVTRKYDFMYQDVKTLSHVPNWNIEKVKYNIENGYCRLMILGSDPDLFKDIDPEKVKMSSFARMKAMKPYQYYSMNNIGQWSILAYPNLAWAKKVFPGLNDEDCMNALWQAILRTSRIEEGKTVSNWIKHNQEIKEHSKKLNDYNFKSLHFKNSLGTDLIVGLIENHIWEGGCDLSHGNFKCEFNPNIPTEEVFTMPDRYRIDGSVVSTKPLSYNGNLIPRFELTFKDGQVIRYDAKENKNILENLLNTDKGSKSLGEVALISYDSPISNTNILFYETLFDENASCHLALGACYPTNIKGGSEMSSEELYELGGNDSMEHCDFMFGSPDMKIVGTMHTGEEIVVFENGNFVI